MVNVPAFANTVLTAATPFFVSPLPRMLLPEENVTVSPSKELSVEVIATNVRGDVKLKKSANGTAEGFC